MTAAKSGIQRGKQRFFNPNYGIFGHKETPRDFLSRGVRWTVLFFCTFPKTKHRERNTVLCKESDSGFFRFNDSHLQKCKSEHGKQPEAFAGQIFGFLFRKYSVPGFRKVIYIKSYLLT